MGRAVADRVDAAEDEVAPPSPWFGLRTVYLLLLGATLLALLWAWSFPVPASLTALACLGGLLLFGLVWVAGVVQAVIEPGRGRPVPPRRWLLVAAGMVVVTALLLAVDAPLEVRWRLSRDAFDEVAARAAPGLDPDESGPVDIGSRIGSYRVIRAHHEGRALYVTVRGGGFLSSAGFAHLPDGPVVDDSDGQTFEHLDGDWYAWSADFD